MEEAFKEAEIAYSLDEVPVGAVIVKDNRVISRAHNRRETDNNSLYHAEILAIDKCCKEISNWRLSGCTIYITLEPCPMCAGAILNSRIERVVYAANDIRCGAFSTVINLNNIEFYKEIEVVGGVCKKKSVELLKDFFSSLRERKK